MNFNSLAVLFRTRDLWVAFFLRRDLTKFLRVHFLYAAFETELLRVLEQPGSLEEVAARIGERRELLEPFLELGVAVGELSCNAGLYRLRGRRSKKLASIEGDPLAAWIQESVSYHGSVYREFARRIKGAPLGDYLAGAGNLIARSSRILESCIADFARTVVNTGKPLHLLEVGCGSGIYLRYAAEVNSQLTGVAVDIQEEVVRQARANVKSWGLSERFDIRVGDILAFPPDLSGPFDVVTLYNNIYYFPVEARNDLFRQVRSLLATDGTFALVSVFKSRSVETTNFDLILRSTIGCACLPELRELTGQLQQSGFNKIEQSQLAPGGWFFGVRAN
jgi:SAM-dependent methyltransferase